MTKNYYHLKLYFSILFSLGLHFSSSAQIGELIFYDEFTSLNTKVWNPIIGNGSQIGLYGWGNAELQYYTPENLTIEPIEEEEGNYALVFTAKDETIESNYFTSGKVDTEGKLSIQYGLIEVRMKTPDLNTGLWPAAWLLGTSNLGWPAKGEIDMMEMGHRQDDKAFQGFPSADINSYVGANAIFATDEGGVGMIAFDQGYNKPYVSSTPMNDRFVVYRLYWDKTSMRFTVIDNDVEYDLYEAPLGIDPNEVTGVFDQPFYFLLNMAVGGNFTDAATVNQVTATLPAKMYVDYLRIYEWNGQGNVKFDYGILEEETGVYGIYTENNDVDKSLVLGSDAEIYSWNNLESNAYIEPNEGSNVLNWNTINGGEWFGAGITITTLYGKNMSRYEENGYLKFDIKIPSYVSFKIGITDTYTNQSYVNFPAGETTYGLVRNGEWGTVEIPLKDFSGNMNFQNVNNIFSIANTDDDIPSSTFDFAIDNVYWTENNETLSNDAFEYTFSNATAGVYPTPAKNLINIVIPESEKFTMVQIIDLAGNIVKNESTIGNKILKLKIADLSAGFYMVKLFNDNKKTKLYKIVKQ